MHKQKCVSKKIEKLGLVFFGGGRGGLYHAMSNKTLQILVRSFKRI